MINIYQSSENFKIFCKNILNVIIILEHENSPKECIFRSQRLNLI